MPDQVLPNNPYARPINATHPEGQMLQGEYYGERSSDKSLAGHGGRQVSSASRFVSKAIAVPVDMDAPDGMSAPSEPKRKAGRPPGSKNRVKATIDDIVPLDELEEPTTPSPDVTSPSDEQATVTEDDLFG